MWPKQKVSETLDSSKIPKKYLTFTFGEITFSMSFTFGEIAFTFWEIKFSLGEGTMILAFLKINFLSVTSSTSEATPIPFLLALCGSDLMMALCQCLHDYTTQGSGPCVSPSHGISFFFWEGGLGTLGNGRNTVSRVLFRKRELTEFRGKLGEFCEKLGEFDLAHK